MAKTNPLLQKIGETIKAKRKKLGWTQPDLARKVQSTQSEISRLERGDGNLTVLTLCKYIKVLNLRIKLTDRRN